MKLKLYSTIILCLSLSALISCKKKSTENIIPTDPDQVQTVILSDDISADMVLNPANIYILKGKVYVKNNVSLTIPAGTTVQVEASDATNNKGALIITRGSRININGTSDSPVIFTSSAALPKPGDWIGIIVLGKASTNGTNGMLHVSGLDNTADNEFGGKEDDDNSGSIKFLRLEYAGGLNPAMEEEWALDMASGLSLNGVGSATVLENVMIAHSNDDAFQFVGGTVNGKYLVAYNDGDDDFDFDRGYRGKLQFLISYRSVSSTVAIRANGMESLNDKDASDAKPYTRPVISNMTIIGPKDDKPLSDQSQGIYIRRNTRFNVQNSIIAGYSNGGLMLCPKTKPILINDLGSIFKYNLVHADDPARSFTYDNGPTGVVIGPDPQVMAWAIESGAGIEKASVNNNSVVQTFAGLMMKTQYSSAGTDASPQTAAPSLSGADFSDPDFSSFKKVSYKGALAIDDTWSSKGNWLKWN
ncbi:MAG: hypothetical protein EOO89_00945 [Pedobacter sp.]|nr:MAG: hypothetical protein EOO89_00945 [Pedobacter sp.]